MNRRIFGKLAFGTAAVGVVSPLTLSQDKTPLRWIRTCLRVMKQRVNADGASYDEQFDGVYMMFLRGIRSDGQMFISFAPCDCEDATPERLRVKLDSMLTDRPLSGVVNATEMRRNLTTDRYKGMLGWEEE
jgi:hypothetical protein